MSSAASGGPGPGDAGIGAIRIRVGRQRILTEAGVHGVDLGVDEQLARRRPAQGRVVGAATIRIRTCPRGSAAGSVREPNRP
jgi:hypothetical protein